MLQKLEFIEQFAYVIGIKCSLWHCPEPEKHIEIPYEEVIKLPLGSILDMMNNGVLYHKPAKED